MAITASARPGTFYGWRVVAGAFVLAVFGWGIGFYGPPVFLHAVQEKRHWPLLFVSSMVTTHFLVGALVVANLSRLYRRFGVAAVTEVGAPSYTSGVQMWNGTMATLKPKPTTNSAAPAISSGLGTVPAAT